jgi:hypothetical protein
MVNAYFAVETVIGIAPPYFVSADANAARLIQKSL